MPKNAALVARMLRDCTNENLAGFYREVFATANWVEAIQSAQDADPEIFGTDEPGILIIHFNGDFFKVKVSKLRDPNAYT